MTQTRRSAPLAARSQRPSLRPGGLPPVPRHQVWLISTCHGPGGTPQYGSWVRANARAASKREQVRRGAGSPGPRRRVLAPGRAMSMVHAYGLAARAPVWLICTRPKPGPREYGSWVRAWPGRGEGSWCAHGSAKARAGGVLTGTPRRPGRGSADRVCKAQKKGGEAFASPLIPTPDPEVYGCIVDADRLAFVERLILLPAP